MTHGRTFGEDSIIRLIHITDPHLSSLTDQPLWRLRGKRWSGYVSWRGKRRFEHCVDRLEVLSAAIRDEHPTQILVTGDLVNVGLPAEVLVARRWLESLGHPDRVVVVPGNHDIYAPDSHASVAEVWGDYLLAPSAGNDPIAPGYPRIRRLPTAHGPLCLIGLSSAQPSPPFMAWGRLGAAQLETLSKQLSRQAGMRCLLIHHPPLRGMTTRRKGLRDARALEHILARQGAELILHGHLHRNVTTHGPGGVRIFGTAPASATCIDDELAASYRRFDIYPAADQWSFTMQRMSVAADGFARVIETLTWQVPVRSPASTCADVRSESLAARAPSR